MITRKHKITAILIGQILMLLVIFQFGQIWWLGLIAICIGLLPWLAGGSTTEYRNSSTNGRCPLIGRATTGSQSA